MVEQLGEGGSILVHAIATMQRRPRIVRPRLSSRYRPWRAQPVRAGAAAAASRTPRAALSNAAARRLAHIAALTLARAPLDHPPVIRAAPFGVRSCDSGHAPLILLRRNDHDFNARARASPSSARESPGCRLRGFSSRAMTSSSMKRPARIGGHSNTVLVPVDGREIPVDTGFIVFNPQTYPNFVELLRVLDVASEPSDMSFGVSIDGGGLEYSGSSLSGLFGQRTQSLPPARFWSMLARPRAILSRGDARRRNARRRAPEPRRLSRARRLRRARFATDHILPMAAAIWSAALPTISAPIPPPPSSASTTITACCSSAAARSGARSTAAAGPMSSA